MAEQKARASGCERGHQRELFYFGDQQSRHFVVAVRAQLCGVLSWHGGQWSRGYDETTGVAAIIELWERVLLAVRLKECDRSNHRPAGVAHIFCRFGRSQLFVDRRLVVLLEFVCWSFQCCFQRRRIVMAQTIRLRCR
eukprot:COSAG03_NODE_6453_length_1058_cov_0.590198_2_plen_138_part_00